ncbi:MAG: hypothetical protein LQ340_002633 [Diploschistes diacapsis]|nr:MAG: hypothetical protein LQ340_002633 [Diploschistes diacapsis]
MVTITDWVTDVVYVTVTAGEPSASPKPVSGNNQDHHTRSTTWTGEPRPQSSTGAATSTSAVATSSSSGFSSTPASSSPQPSASTTMIIVPSSSASSSSSTPTAAASASTAAAASSSAPVPASSPSSTSSSSSTGVSSDGSPLSGGVSILTTINAWRTAYNLNTLTWDASLANDAHSTGVANNGGDTTSLHHPGGYPDSFAEVITPGMSDELAGYNLQGDTPFELAWVSWLCEVSTDSELQASGFTGVDQCGVVSQVLNMQYSDTGHHDICTSNSYQTVGCSFVSNPSFTSGGGDPYQGLWSCDFGFSSS